MKFLGTASLVLVASAAYSQITVVPPANATAVEARAAAELTAYLKDIRTSRPLRVLVGASPDARRDCPDIEWDKLGEEEIVLRSVRSDLVVVGGSPRGTRYAVNRLLARMGVRWWTPWATSRPARLKLPQNLNVREKPAFEYRGPYWAHAFDKDWAAHSAANGLGNYDADHGGGIGYEGFVHTYYPLTPPEKYFAIHPEWYSLINGQRTAQNAQLCTTNPEMRQALLEEVRRRLRANPEAKIVSVSQNDCFNPCQCERCQAIAKAEGSEAGPVLDLANYVADNIREEFPGVAVDTLAYQYTRHAPKNMRPRPNVIVRLCSIECDFGIPLTDPRNADFARDIRDWSRLTQRLYVWDYVTNFSNYIQPFPNVQVLGPNLKFFAENGVKGVFEEGDYNGNGGEMAELKSWMLAQLLWDPKADPVKLREEFLRGYYGRAARPIGRYLDLMAKVARAHPAHIFDNSRAKYLDYPTMKEAERLFVEAEKADQDPEIRRRVAVAHLAVRYVWLHRWAAFRQAATKAHDPWPLPETRAAAADQWLAVAKAPGPAGWQPVSAINEANRTVESFTEEMRREP